MQDFMKAMATPFLEQQKDRQFRTITIVLTTIIAVVLFASAISLWPVMISAAGGEGSFAETCYSMCISSIKIMALALIISLATPDSRYGFMKIYYINCIIGFAIFLLTLFLNPLKLPGVEDTSFFLGLLRVIIYLMTSIVATLLPALVGNTVGWVVRWFYTLIASSH